MAPLHSQSRPGPKATADTGNETLEVAEGVEEDGDCFYSCIGLARKALRGAGAAETGSVLCDFEDADDVKVLRGFVVDASNASTHHKLMLQPSRRTATTASSPATRPSSTLSRG
jgi:hypothetical protein